MNSIEKLSGAKRALIEAQSLDDIAAIHDIAVAAQTYAKAAKLGMEAQNEAAEVARRAERKAGEVLREMPKAQGKRTDLVAACNQVDDTPTLSELGINKTESHRWQQIASVPEEKFEEYIETANEITQAGLLRIARGSNGEPLPELPTLLGLAPEDIIERINSLKYPPTIYSHNWIYGVWYCGTSFQKAKYYGQYPMTFVTRVTTMFPPQRFDFLHACCGRCHIDNATNVDVIKLPEADIIVNIEELSFPPSSFDICLIDPPYSQEDSTRYGVPRLISAKKSMKSIGDCMRPGGWLLWLDEKYPSFDKKMWRLNGLIAIVTGANRRARILSMYRRTEW